MLFVSVEFHLNCWTIPIENILLNHLQLSTNLIDKFTSSTKFTNAQAQQSSKVQFTRSLLYSPAHFILRYFHKVCDTDEPKRKKWTNFPVISFQLRRDYITTLREKWNKPKKNVHFCRICMSFVCVCERAIQQNVQLFRRILIGLHCNPNHFDSIDLKSLLIFVLYGKGID